MSEIRDRDELVLTVNRLMICAMEDIDSGRNEASPTTLDLVRRIEDHDAALRLALETATRERDEAETALRPLAALAVEYEKMSLPDGTAIVTVQKNDPAGNVVLLISDAVRARRYFARREGEKGGSDV